MPSSVGCLAKLSRHGLQGVEVDAIRTDVRQQACKSDPGRFAFVARACIPRKNRKKDFYAPAVKLLNDLAKRRNPTRQIAQEVKLIAIIYTDVRINMPDQHCVDRANAVFSLSQKFVNRVFALVRIVETSIPDE